MKIKTASRLDKTVAFVAVVALAADRQGFPSKSWWALVDARASWLVVILLALAGIFSLSPLTARAETRAVSGRTALQRQIFIFVGHLITEVQKAIPGFDHTDLGLHTWQVRRSRRLPWRKQLVRVGTYRLGGAVQLRDFRPKKGVGVVGQCWEDNAEKGVDVEALATTLSTEDAFVQATAATPREGMGLNWKGFVQVRHRGAVFAAPIRDKKGSFRGCASLDASGGYVALQASVVPQILNELVLMLSDHEFSEM